MFNRRKSAKDGSLTSKSCPDARSAPVFCELLEDRRLFSSSAHAAHLAHLAHLRHLAHIGHMAHLAALSVTAQAASTTTNTTGTATSTTTSGDDQTILFSAAPAAVKTGLRALAPAGVTIAASQVLDVDTDNGVTTYSTDLTANSQVTRIAVDSTGAAVTEDLGDDSASDQTILFSAAPAAVKTGLQSLAPSGVTVADPQTLKVDTESSGTTIYSIELSISGQVTRLAVDSTGAALTNDQGEHRGHGGGGGCG